MPLLKERTPAAPHEAVPRPRRRSALRRRYKAALTVLTLLALAGKTILIDTKAVDAVVQVLHHLHLFGF